VWLAEWWGRCQGVPQKWLVQKWGNNLVDPQYIGKSVVLQLTVFHILYINYSCKCWFCVGLVDFDIAKGFYVNVTKTSFFLPNYHYWADILLRSRQSPSCSWISQWNSSVRNFLQPHIISSPLGPHIAHSTLASNRIFSSQRRPDRFWDPPSPPYNEYQGLFPRGVNRPRREVDHSPPTCVEVNKTWIYTSTLPVRLHGVVFN
jgi:hypothetical protein